MPLENKKLMSLADAVKWREEMRAQGQKVIMTNGGFDLLHAGHLYYLQAARQKADALVVLMNSDTSVRGHKGPLRPVNAQEHRAYALAACWFVDAVVIFDSARVVKEIEALRPDIYCKSAEFNVETIPQEERKAAEAVGAQIIFLPFLEGFSTTKLIERIKAAAGV